MSAFGCCNIEIRNVYGWQDFRMNKAFDQFTNKAPCVCSVLIHVDNLPGIEARIGNSVYILSHLIRVYIFLTLRPFRNGNLDEHEHLASEYNLGRKVSVDIWSPTKRLLFIEAHRSLQTEHGNNINTSTTPMHSSYPRIVNRPSNGTKKLQ